MVFSGVLATLMLVVVVGYSSQQTCADKGDALGANKGDAPDHVTDVEYAIF